MSIRELTGRLHRGVIAKSDDRRQGYRIDRVFQSRFRSMMLVFSILILLMVTVLTRAVLYVMLNPDSVPVSPWVPGSLFAFAAGIGLAVFYLSDRISHRYCGPVYRFSMTLDAVLRGERPRPICLRKYDEYQELATKLNEALQQLGAMDRPADQATDGSADPSVQ